MVLNKVLLTNFEHKGTNAALLSCLLTGCVRLDLIVFTHPLSGTLILSFATSNRGLLGLEKGASTSSSTCPAARRIIGVGIPELRDNFV